MLEQAGEEMAALLAGICRYSHGVQRVITVTLKPSSNFPQTNEGEFFINFLHHKRHEWLSGHQRLGLPEHQILSPIDQPLHLTMVIQLYV